MNGSDLFLRGIGRGRLEPKTQDREQASQPKNGRPSVPARLENLIQFKIERDVGDPCRDVGRCHARNKGRVHVGLDAGKDAARVDREHLKLVVMGSFGASCEPFRNPHFSRLHIPRQMLPDENHGLDRERDIFTAESEKRGLEAFEGRDVHARIPANGTDRIAQPYIVKDRLVVFSGLVSREI